MIINDPIFLKFLEPKIFWVQNRNFASLFLHSFINYSAEFRPFIGNYRQSMINKKMKKYRL